MSNLILSITDAYVTFGKIPLFEELSFNIHEGDKICLVGKNGAGKTTLMHMISGERELDGGERWSLPGLEVGYLQQDPPFDPEMTVFDYVHAGLSEEYQGEEYHYRVTMVVEPLNLREQDKMGDLSGGQQRRAALARSLVDEPDVLMLDEPTNHLDLEGIEWLEGFLKHYRGTVLCISHDKTFLANISNKVFWLDRGTIRVCPKGFGHFEQWSTELLEHEARELKNRESALAQEIEWASRGVKARRKRNVRRLQLVHEAKEKLRADKYQFRKVNSKVELAPLEASQSSNVVVEFFKVRKSYGEGADKTRILDNFNLRVMKGERIGILGKNGCGKTSFLKLLVGDEAPDAGKIKRAHTLEISYFDQKRRMLNPEHSIRRNLCTGDSEYVMVGQKQRHVCGYMKDFMFDPKEKDTKVATLSGGQKNRLMLAKVLAKPGGLLILDEPTNDLDMETLDMLEEILANYDGTLFIVSHDRDFLDQTVTKTLAFEGDGQVDSYIGGYSDYLKESGKLKSDETKSRRDEERKKRNIKKNGNDKKTAQHKTENAAVKIPLATPKKEKKLTFTLQHELDELPSKMEVLEAEMKRLSDKLADPDFYMNEPQEFDRATRHFARAREKMDVLEARWLELEELKE